MNNEQKVIFSHLTLKRDEFSAYPQKMFSIRLSDEHNRAHHLLETKAAPNANVILSILQGMVANQRSLLDEEISQHSRELNTLNTKVLFSIFLGLFLTVVLGFIINRSFNKLDQHIQRKTKELADSDATNKGILNTSKDAIVSITPQGTILSCNQSTLAMFGYRQEELLGQNIKILMPEEYALKHDGYLAEHMRTGIKKPIWVGARELLAKRKDDTTLPIVLTIGSIDSDKGKIFTGFIRDITTQKTTQIELETMNQTLTQENNCQEQIATINELMHGASDMYRLGESIIVALAELIGASHGIFYRYDSDQQDLAMVSSYALSGNIDPSKRLQLDVGLIGQCAKNHRSIHTTELPDNYLNISSGLGNSQPRELYIVPLLHEGNLLGVIELASFTSISDEHKTIINAIRHDIGVVVNNVVNIENTNLLLKKMKLQSDALQEQSEKLATSNAYKSDFLATMSHEIRTPMNGVLGMLAMLVKSDLSDEQMKKATLARSSAQSLLTIINDILDFSKVEAGKLELELLDFDLRDQLEEIAELMAIRAHAKGLNLNLDLVGIQYSLVKGDASRIRQVLINLIGNAIKFTHQGDITIQASLEPCEPDQLSFNCVVVDSGVGIKEEHLTKLFEAFRQADASTTREFGGTGLGLSISKNLCELMGGDISVTSTLGQGSRFSFTLQLSKSAQAIRLKSPLQDKTLRVLVADDHLLGRNIICRQLKAWGAQVSTADTALGTMEWLEKQVDEEHFQLAFISTELNALTPSQILNSKHPDTEIVFIGSHNDNEQMMQHERNGDCRYIHKPVTPSDIFDVLIEQDDYRQVRLQKMTSSAFKPNSETETATVNNWADNTRVLLVEDNLINQETMKFMFDDLGLVPDIASDGQEALDLLNCAGDRPYSLVLMDCQMPNMDGFTATQKIRSGAASPDNTKIPIVALTANAMSGDRERCLDAGMSDYLSKPIDYDVFNGMLKKWLA